MTKKLPVWKINRSDFLRWRYEGCSDDIDSLDNSCEILESLKKTGKYEYYIDVDEILSNCGYLPCSYIENLKEVLPDHHEDDEIHPEFHQFEVEWIIDEEEKDATT